MNQKGFTIIELVIAASIASFLSLAIASMMVQQQKSNIYISDQLKKNDFDRIVQQMMAENPSCNRTLAGTIIPPGPGRTVNVPALRESNGTVVYRSNSVSDFLQIGQMSVENISVTARPGVGSVRFRVPVERQRDGGGPKEFRPFQTTVRVTVNAAGNITACGAESTHSGLELGSVSSERGSVRVNFTTPLSRAPSYIGITPRWARFTSDEDTTWWVDAISNTGFTIEWKGPRSGSSTHGTDGVYWTVIE